MDALSLDTVLLSEDRKSLKILDQTLLPGKVKVLELGELKDIWEAIKSLRVRGAPAIGVCAAYALAIGAAQIAGSDNKRKADEAGGAGFFDNDSKSDCKGLDTESFLIKLKERSDYLASARPTAVNLSWALNRLMRLAEQNRDREPAEIVELLYKEADKVREEDIAISRSIGEIGYKLLKPGCGILTHCNAGTLATAKYGTATAPMYIAAEQGMTDFRVYCDETRPLLQGARLTAFEMQGAGFDTSLICDNMASYMMKQGKIDIIFVGCDRVARNGDAANKIGTSGVAVLAKYYGIPFYVCAPSSTIDMSIADGSEIPIEERAAEEVTEMWYKERMAPEGVKVCNPAFDVTDHSLITGIITEKGLCKAPFDKAFEELGIV